MLVFILLKQKRVTLVWCLTANNWSDFYCICDWFCHLCLLVSWSSCWWESAQAAIGPGLPGMDGSNWGTAFIGGETRNWPDQTGEDGGQRSPWCDHCMQAWRPSLVDDYDANCCFFCCVSEYPALGATHTEHGPSSVRRVLWESPPELRWELNLLVYFFCLFSGKGFVFTI